MLEGTSRVNNPPQTPSLLEHVILAFFFPTEIYELSYY